MEWFLSLDIKSAYWQLRLHENTKPLTAFTCPPEKQYEWNVLPFGLKQAPSIFQRFMDNNLSDLEHICLAYIDDILIFTKGTEQEHLKAVQEVLIRCKEKGLILSKAKARICKREIDYLGLTFINEGLIKLQPHILENLTLFPDEISDVKSLQRFLGCINYIVDQAFYKNLARERATLQKKLKKDVHWTWTAEDTLLVQHIKQYSKNLPTLYNPTAKDYIIIETDASNDVWTGCVKAIKDCDGYPEGKTEEKLCKYLSGTFQSSEKNYHITEKETLAALRVFQKWRIDLLPKFFTLRTDSAYLTNFCRYQFKGNYKQGRLLRWQLQFGQYSFNCVFIKSDKNSLADTLTREWSKLAEFYDRKS